MPEQINTDEWLAEMDRLASEQEPDDEGLTVKEMAERYGRTPRTMRNRVKEWLEDGKVIQGMGMRVNSVGRRMPVRVYKPKEDCDDAR